MDERLKIIRNDLIGYLEEVNIASRHTEELAAKNKQMISEIQQLKLHLAKRSEEIRSLTGQLTALNDRIAKLQAEKVAFVLNARKESSAQHRLVQQKYENDILSSRIKSLERELHVQKTDTERLKIENQNMKRHRIVSANNYY